MNKKFIFGFLLFLVSSICCADENLTRVSWLTGELYGNDNKAAALRKVKINEQDGKYKIYIKNQFQFECDLEFNNTGNPSIMSNCISREGPQPVCDPNMPNSACARSRNCFQVLPETNPNCYYTWQVKEPTIKLTCFQTRSEYICKGKYTLTTSDGYSDPSEFTIAKRKK